MSFSGCDTGNVRESLVLVALPYEVHGVGLHFRPKISLPQCLVGQGLLPSVIAADPLMYFLEYVVPFFEVDTLQEGVENPLL